MILRKGLAVALVAASLFAACATDPGPMSPETAAAFEQDCNRRGGTWDKPKRVCVGADPRGY